jgi:BirA family biotin operon repressor/biotin-[acetyl-CoA-carboxylase] ligase
LKSNPSDLPADLAQSLARARSRFVRLGSRIEFFPAIGSTNDEAAARGGEGTIVIADQQTAGRGRRGHTWFSPPGSGLYVSVVVTPSRARVEPQRATTLLTLAAGVAVAEGIQSAAALHVDLKWPNDLFVARRKLGGILAEAADGEVVLGYGINVRTTAYPPEFGDRATAVETELGRPVERDVILVETLAALDRRYVDLLDGRFDAILDAWRARAPAAVGARVEWATSTGTRCGVTNGIDSEGALMVRIGDQSERIVSGELTWI